MSRTIGDKQIGELRQEAQKAGDDEQVRICQDALAGDAKAREECVRVLVDQYAQDDEVWKAYQRAEKAAELAELTEEQDSAHNEMKEAEAAFLRRVVEMVKPSLRALVSRVQNGEKTWWPSSSRPVTKEAWFEWKGLHVAGDGPIELYPDGSAGNIGGRDLFLDNDGIFVEVSYHGDWSRWQGASQGWRTTYTFPSCRQVVSDYVVGDVVGVIDAAVEKQLSGNRTKRTKAMLSRATKLNALTTLLK